MWIYGLGVLTLIAGGMVGGGWWYLPPIIPLVWKWGSGMVVASTANHQGEH